MHATYSPEDNKIRLYFDGVRIPRDEWDALKAKGFSWTMKQASDMVATWTPGREDAALELCGEIDDEDQPRAERSADRAERFMDYQDKREGEASAFADLYDAGPSIHAYQSESRATAAAKRHDVQAARAVSAWGKAEYWQRRTAGVIAHALYQERADVRHRRIKELEADERRIVAEYVPSKIYEGVDYVKRYAYNPEKSLAAGHDCVGIFGQGRAQHPRSFCKATGPKSMEGNRWLAHIRLRLAYERQMLEAQGGTAADIVDMEPGGFIDGHQVQKVTKGRNGRIVGVWFVGPHPYKAGQTCLHKIAAENIKPERYRMPTQAERAAFADEKAEKPKGPKLINPDADAVATIKANLDAVQAAEHKRHSSSPYQQITVREMTSDEWKRHTSDSWRVRNWRNVRIRSGGGWRGISVLVVITDSKRSPLPAETETEDPSNASAAG